MIVVPTTPLQRKHGPARRPKSEISAKTIRNRRCIDKKCLKELVATGIDPPSELLHIEEAIKGRGRPPLSDEVIERNEHASARRQRICRARAAAQRALADAEAAAAMAQLACASEAEAEAERLAAKQAKKMRKLERHLDARNASDGVVADGPRAVRLTAAVIRSVECCIGGSDELCAEAYPMRCCSQGMCAACLRVWLRRNGQRQDMGYGDGASSVPVDGDASKGAHIDRRVRDGRRYTKKIKTHHCPLCRRPVESVRRGLVTCE